MRDFQKREAIQCVWNNDGRSTPKRLRNKGKGRGKDRQLIRAELAEAGSAADIERELKFDEEADLASWCYHYGPCAGCREKNDDTID